MEATTEQLKSPRGFNITPKTSVDSLREMKFKALSVGGVGWNEKYRAVNANGIITNDIVQNVVELIQHEVPPVVLYNISASRQTSVGAASHIVGYEYQHDAQTCHGKQAISLSISTEIGISARKNKLDMSSPDIVCMCGSELLRLTHQSKERIGKRIGLIEGGKVKFVSEEAKEKEVAKNRAIFNSVDNFAKELRGSMIEYAKQRLSPEKQQKLLQSLVDVE